MSHHRGIPGKCELRVYVHNANQFHAALFISSSWEQEEVDGTNTPKTLWIVDIAICNSMTLRDWIN